MPSSVACFFVLWGEKNMSEQLLNKLNQGRGEIYIKLNGEVCIVVDGEIQLLDQLERWENARIFAQGIQLALSFFIGYKPTIRMEK